MGDPNIISDNSKLSFSIPVSVVNEEADYYTQEDVFKSVNYKISKATLHNEGTFVFVTTETRSDLIFDT